MLSWLLDVSCCPLAVTGYRAGGTFDLTPFVYFSMTVNYSDWELMRMGIMVGHAERRSHCAERTIQAINVDGPGREGHFTESWEIMSTGIVTVVWNPVVWNVRVTGLAVCCSSLLIWAAPWKEQGEGCRCRKTSTLLSPCRAVVLKRREAGKGRPWLNRHRQELAGCWEKGLTDFTEGN